MFDRTLADLQAARLNMFLADYLPRHRAWWQPQVADPGRIYKRDDDLADELVAEPGFAPVLEAFYLGLPQNPRLRAVIIQVDLELPFELVDLIVAALRISAKRIGSNPGLLPLRRRVAVSLLFWRLAIFSRRDRGPQDPPLSKR